MNAIANTLSALNNRTAVEMLDANKAAWGGRITYRDNKDGTHTATYTQGGEVVGTGIGVSKESAKIALAHACN